MSTDISIDAVLQWYDVPAFSHADALGIGEIPDRTMQVWYQRGHLALMQMTSPGRGKRRKYTLAQLLYLSYMRRLTFLSIPVAQASTIASVFLPVRTFLDASGSPVTRSEVAPILPALEVGQDPDCDRKVYGLVYRHIDGQWTNRVATVDEFEAWGGLLGWVTQCVLDDMVLVCDLGRMARTVLAGAMRTSRWPPRGE